MKLYPIIACISIFLAFIGTAIYIWIKTVSNYDLPKDNINEFDI